MKKPEFVSVGNRLTAWTVHDYDVRKIAVQTVSVTVRLDDVNVARNGPAKIAKKQFANQIIAIIMEFAILKLKNANAQKDILAVSFFCNVSPIQLNHQQDRTIGTSIFGEGPIEIVFHYFVQQTVKLNNAKEDVKMVVDAIQKLVDVFVLAFGVANFVPKFRNRKLKKSKT